MMSSRKWRRPSVSAAYSRPSAPVTICSQGVRRTTSMLSSPGTEQGATATGKAAGSKSARQMIRAAGARRSGCSAKVKPPAAGIGQAAGDAARLRMPGDIIRITAQPFPHQSRAVDTMQRSIEQGILPIFSGRIISVLSHCRFTALTGPASGGKENARTHICRKAAEKSLDRKIHDMTIS